MTGEIIGADISIGVMVLQLKIERNTNANFKMVQTKLIKTKLNQSKKCNRKIEAAAKVFKGTNLLRRNDRIS